jgi:hypothetical protein
MIASQFIMDPLRGATTLWRVVWLYSLVGGAVLQIVALVFAGEGGSAKAIALVGLAYGSYGTFAAYRCAGNNPWPSLGRLVRLCALISLCLVPLVAYLILNDKFIQVKAN